MKHSEQYENLTLAIDTSSKASSVALAANQTVIASVDAGGSSQTSRILFREIEALLDLSGVKPDQVERFGAVTGPGSFTGLRVGLAVIEAMSRTLKRPAIGISAFDAAAASTGIVGRIAVVLEAGKAEVFLGIRTVREDGEVITEDADGVIDPRGVVESLIEKFPGEKLAITGSGLDRHVELFRADVRALAENATVDWSVVSSTRFLAAAAARLSAVRSLDANRHPLRAYYIKPPDALAAKRDAIAKSPVTVGHADPNEIESVVRLEVESGLTSRGVDSYRSFINENGAILLVARSGSTGDGQYHVVGSVSALLVADELQIDNLVVDPGLRRRGIGHKLMTRALMEALDRGASSAVLEVRTSSEAARALYRGLGFREVGMRKEYYSHPPEDALTMVLELGDMHSRLLERI